MKKTVWKLREHGKNIIAFEKKKILPLTKEELKSHQDAKAYYICRERILKNAKDINYRKVRDHFQYTGKYRGAAHSICNLKIMKLLNEVTVVFHNGSNYDYHFIIKELTNKFEGQFECLVGNK